MTLPVEVAGGQEDLVGRHPEPLCTAGGVVLVDGDVFVAKTIVDAHDGTVSPADRDLRGALGTVWMRIAA